MQRKIFSLSKKITENFCKLKLDGEQMKANRRKISIYCKIFSAKAHQIQSACVCKSFSLAAAAVFCVFFGEEILRYFIAVHCYPLRFHFEAFFDSITYVFVSLINDAIN